MRTGTLSFYFSTKTYAVATQENRLNKTVILSTQNIGLDCWVRIIASLLSKLLLNCTYASNSDIYYYFISFNKNVGGHSY